MKIYDIIIIGGGAAGLFTSIRAKKGLSKLILEKNKTMGVKVLLSGGERANVSNMDIEPVRDYFGQNRKAMISIYNSFNNWDLMSWFSDAGINIIEEDRGRLILESGDSRELLDVLVRESKKNNTDHSLNSEVLEIIKPGKNFEILTNKGKYSAKNIVISSGGRSFMHVGTVGDSYKFLEKFGHKIASPHRGLSGLVTREDLKEVSGVSSKVSINILNKGDKRPIYSETGPMLFTHFGVSGPIIHNAGVAIGEFLNSKKIYDETEREEYLKENISMSVRFDLEDCSKSLKKLFELSEDNLETEFGILGWRSWKEAKVTGGGVLLDEFDKTLQSKLVSGLYVGGEALDITGKTGGFNLQLAWSSGNVIGEAIS